MAKKILLVEDNPVNMRLIRLTLKNDNYEFVEAVNGEEALSMAELHLPDLIVLDIQIPKIDGYEVARRLKQNEKCKSIPIIALTAHAMKGDEEKIISSGCDMYVSKPFDTQKFKMLVHSVFEK
jgi:two-component system, cell cycle response regulator DivK